MSATICRFPPRRSQVVWLLPERLGGWFAIYRGHAWLFASYREAVAEALALAHQHGGLRVLAEEPR